MSALVITVHDTPAPQGSKRAVVHRSSGNAVLMESSAKVKPWREAVKQAALDAVAQLPDRAAWASIMIDPVDVEVTFTLARPRSHYRTGRNASVLRDAAPVRPHRTPDVDKLLRSTLDALTAAGVWADDAQVVELTGRKVYPGAGLDALEHPGALIRVHALAPVLAGVSA